MIRIKAYYGLAIVLSSRRRHTRLTCDWSSDVCSSDVVGLGVRQGADEQHGGQGERGEELFHGRPFRLVGGRVLEDRTRWLHQGWLNRSATSVRDACLAGSSAATAATPAVISGTPASAGSQMRPVTGSSPCA